ncbi:acetoacetate-CoA ligase [Piedraia hortae CBS 480.64]|uniref:Acetoacetate-CoA ligase n=1 Tax=Piedraia hortae CBS 480.64 TaxID=1314780 RepID=A0A6A7BWK3_9PEZI|nr:acetoacetate-CoA ligase [Piedraia hortae CBS 480.64]
MDSGVLKLWEHPSPESTQLWAFIQIVNKQHKLNLTTYDDLYKWSISNISTFWATAWSFCGVRNTAPYNAVVSSSSIMFPRPAWFSGARLNFAENLLFPKLPGGRSVAEGDVAVIAATESSRESVTWADLRKRLLECQNGMRSMNIRPGDRVAGYVGNHLNALVAMLAATSLGAVWTAVSPDTGVTAVLDRLVQIEPRLVFADAEVVYNGKTHPVLPKVKEIVAGLPSVEKCVVFDQVDQTDRIQPFTTFTSKEHGKLHFEQLPPDHQVYILYSSGTTGVPKCIVHGAIGTLLQHKKEHILQCDLRPTQRLFYYTTCTWMMWHWLVSGLASGVTLILYDGSPFYYRDKKGISVKDDLAIPKLIDELEITHFGTSAKYLSILEQRNILPRESTPPLSLEHLKAVYSTGSPLAPSTFTYVYRAFGSINLGSITGGTEIISLFGAPCPLHPVYTGEVQVLGLGMAVEAWDVSGHPVSAGEPGDLVCTKPFPSQPVTFWGPEGEKKYKSSYFAVFNGVWHHGDYVRFSPTTGGLIMLGRSDGVLKPGGVRFGSAEIYNILLRHFAAEVEDAICVGRRRPTDDDESVILFLKMKEGVKLTPVLEGRIKNVIAKELSRRHVPAIVAECPAIPVTANGKKVEGVVRQTVSGIDIGTGVEGRVANGECLKWFKEWAGKN